MFFSLYNKILVLMTHYPKKTYKNHLLGVNYSILATIFHANFGTHYFVMDKVYTNEGGIKQLYHNLPAFSGDNLLTKTPGLCSCTNRQTIV